MSGLPDPVRRGLESPADAESVERVWGAISARRAGVRGSRAPAVWLAAAAVVALAAGGGAALRMRAQGAGQGARAVASAAPTMGSARSPEGGALRLASGASFDPGFLPANESTPVTLSDGSRIDTASSTRLELLANDGRSLVTRLASGRAHFEVTPGGPRRWTIECGAASVEVVGTAFVLDRSDEALRVSVEHGVVLVRGERVPDRVRRLTAGESLVVPAREAAPAPSAVAAVASAVPSSTRPSGLRAPRAGAGGLDPIEAIFDEVGAARSAGRPLEAVALLERLLVEHPRGESAGLAAFMLGRIEADTLHRPSRAAAAFQRAISLGLPERLLEDARARLEGARRAEASRPAAP